MSEELIAADAENQPNEPVPTPAAADAGSRAGARGDERRFRHRPSSGRRTSAPPRRYTARFAIVYAGLGMVLAGALCGRGRRSYLQSGPLAGPSWSTWQPAVGLDGAGDELDREPRRAEYQLNKAGAQLVGVVAEPLAVHERHPQARRSRSVAVRKTANSNNGIRLLPDPEHLRRPALRARHELLDRDRAGDRPARPARAPRGARARALHLQVRPGGRARSSPTCRRRPARRAATLLYFQKANLTQQLSQPLDKTLPLAKPPLPTAPDTSEASTIDKLTLPAVYSYSLAALQDGSARARARTRSPT